MPTDTRQRMLDGAIDLLRRRGVHGTSLRDVVRVTGTPRGSLAHHFPGGKRQLLEDAVRATTEAIAGPLEHLLAQRGVRGGLDAFVAGWKRTLQGSGFEAGCPVVAVAIEPLDPEGDAASEDDDAALRALAAEAFDRWQRLLAAGLRREGVPTARARRLAALVIASLEGAIVMCRAARSLGPLDDVHAEMGALLDGTLRTP